MNDSLSPMAGWLVEVTRSEFVFSVFLTPRLCLFLLDLPAGRRRQSGQWSTRSGATIKGFLQQRSPEPEKAKQRHPGCPATFPWKIKVGNINVSRKCNFP